MNYTVLARKLRPQKFKDLIGQEVLAQTISNSITHDRIAHAFLFTGGRGVGKTSCARILAKALNCSNFEEGEPCNQCENCQEIDKGIASDVMEIDAASNRGIDNIKELKENLKYLPAKGKFKVYIVDEAHMLTPESFNALLKTLEEPPTHVKIILATTEPQKIPITIHSRCQRYDFHNIGLSTMIQYLQKIVQQEEIEISLEALKNLAFFAKGGLRDALTNLDVLISFCGQKIKDEVLPHVLGIVDIIHIEKLMLSIENKDVQNTLDYYHEISNKGVTIPILINGLLEIVHKLSICKAGYKSNADQDIFIESENFLVLQKKLSLSQLQQYFQILLEAEQQTKTSQYSDICFEMELIKMCSVDSLVSFFKIYNQVQKIRALNLENTTQLEAKGELNETEPTTPNLIEKSNSIPISNKPSFDEKIGELEEPSVPNFPSIANPKSEVPDVSDKNQLPSKDEKITLKNIKNEQESETENEETVSLENNLASNEEERKESQPEVLQKIEKIFPGSKILNEHS